MRKTVAIAGLMAVAGLLAPAGAAADHKAGHPGPNANPNFTITAKPAPVRFGLPILISGNLKNGANSTILLQQDSFPFESTFTTVAQTNAAADGGYQFNGVRPFINTRYRAITANGSPTTEIFLVLVAISVRANVSDTSPERGETVKFSGTAKPAHDGATVQIQRRVGPGTYKTLKLTKLEDDGDLRSKYSTGVQVNAGGLYRVRVLGDNDHTNGIKAVTIHVED